MRKKILEEFPNYIICSNGKVYSKRNKSYLHPTVNKTTGYNVVRLYGYNGYKTFSLGKLIADSFLGDEKKKFVKYKDGNKNNTRVSNLLYCDFSELKDSRKIRKTKVISISIEELVSNYKYYFEGIDEKHLFKLIAGNKYYADRIVFEARNGIKTDSLVELKVFLDYIAGLNYKELTAKHQFSLRRVSKAILNMRKSLLNGIKDDVSAGVLQYNPMPNKQSYRKAYTLFRTQEMYNRLVRKTI
jgi:hypothetical protein